MEELVGECRVIKNPSTHLSLAKSLGGIPPCSVRKIDGPFLLNGDVILETKR